ncbi:CLUMA_CG013701, isoform A [Clunio marinus]|uniref:CLUMA_CG013701, isoform A n=1 Tax=Clunio marinus TaxID=568069 RepID=A0A1J1IJM6_9DIPT|nr:CLUMA_CG013701, isoform A [Clunio marinus]
MEDSSKLRNIISRTCVSYPAKISLSDQMAEEEKSLLFYLNTFYELPKKCFILQRPEICLHDCEEA